MKRSLILSAAMMTILLIGSVGFAQTGPVGPSSATPAAPVVQSNGNQLLPDRLADMLRKMGHQVDVRKDANNAVFVTAKIQQDGWQFQVEFEYTIDQRAVYMICQLGVHSNRLSAQQMMNLLRKSYDFHPTHFSVHSATGMLLLESPSYSTMNFSEANAQALLARLLKNARDSHSLWNVQ